MSLTEIVFMALLVFGGLSLVSLVLVQALELVKWKRRAIEAECTARVLREENETLLGRRRHGFTYEGSRVWDH